MSLPPRKLDDTTQTSAPEGVDEALSELLGEIQTLQLGMTQFATGSAPIAASLGLFGATARGHGGGEEYESGEAADAPMEEILAGIRERDESEGEGPSVSQTEGGESEMSEDDSSVIPFRAQQGKAEQGSTQGDEGCLTMTLSGQMRLKLRYEFAGQDITVGFNDGALHVELSDGTEFKIPVHRGASRKQAA